MLQVETIVILIDDQEMLRVLLGYIVETAGAKVEKTYATADSALSDLNSGVIAPDIIFCDNQMPASMEGVDFLAEVRRKDFRSSSGNEIILVLATGDEKPGIQAKAQEYGIYFLKKPYDPKEIIRIIQKHLG